MNEKALLVLEIGNEIGHFEKVFPRLEAIWLDASDREHQRLLLTKVALTQASNQS